MDVATEPIKTADLDNEKSTDLEDRRGSQASKLRLKSANRLEYECLAHTSKMLAQEDLNFRHYVLAAGQIYFVRALRQPSG